MGPRPIKNNPEHPTSTSATLAAYEATWRQFRTFCRQLPDEVATVPDPLALSPRRATALVTFYLAWLATTGGKHGRARATCDMHRAAIRHTFLAAGRQDPTRARLGPGTSLKPRR